MMANANPEGTEGAAPVEEGFLGLSSSTWMGLDVAAFAGFAIGLSRSDGGDDEAPACP
jgi:hypothetical protein